jgi:hypothetical protein
MAIVAESSIACFLGVSSTQLIADRLTAILLELFEGDPQLLVDPDAIGSYPIGLNSAVHSNVCLHAES